MCTPMRLMISALKRLTARIFHSKTSKPDGIPKKQLYVSHLAKLGWRANISLVECLENTFALFRQELVRP